MVDTSGRLLVVAVTAAVQDHDAARTVLARLCRAFPLISLVCADGGCAGKLMAWAQRTLGIRLHIVKRPAPHVFEVLPRRWVAERSLSWIVRRRRRVRDYERLPAHDEAMVRWAMIIVMGRRSARSPRPG